MNHTELRAAFAAAPKHPGSQNAPPAPVCHAGFPGNFNLSFTEYEHLREYGGYLDYSHDVCFSKIQPVIRYNDFADAIGPQTEEAWRYLGLFDLADVGGVVILVDGSRKLELAQDAIRGLHGFLTNVVGLDPSRLSVSFFAGATVREATGGKYSFAHDVPADPAASVWRDCGLRDDQLVPDRSRDTLLALNVYGRPTPWGYRHEIHYPHRGELLDIATFEYLVWRPVFEGDVIVGLAPWPHSTTVAAAGVERLELASEGLRHITDCTHIRPLKAYVAGRSGGHDKDVVPFVDALRVVERVLAETGSYAALSRHRKLKMSAYLRAVLRHGRALGLDLGEASLTEMLEVAADAQPHYPELKTTAARTAAEIVDAARRRAKRAQPVPAM